MNRGRGIGAVAAIVLVAGCATGRPSGRAASAVASWPMFKNGAHRAGVSASAGPNLPLKILWAYRSPGPSNGYQDWGPVAANGVIYTPSGLNTVTALDARSGRVVWNAGLISNVFTVTYAPADRLLLATTSTTTVATPTLFALDPKSGHVLWKNTDRDQPAMGGIEGAPAVDGSTVYVASMLYDGSGNVAAYAVASGQLLWRWTLPGFSPSTPVAVADGGVVVGFDDKRVYCLDAATGTQRWASPSWPQAAAAAPVVRGGLAFVSSGSVVYALDEGTGQEVWHRDVGGPLGASSPAIHGQWLFIGTRDSRVLAIHALDGTVGWATELRVGAIESSPAIDPFNERLYLGTAQNTLVAVDLETGRLLGHLALGPRQGIWRSSPMLYAQRLYIGSLDQTFYAIGSK